MTKREQDDVQVLIESIPNEGRKRDASELLDLMADITSDEPRVWGADTIGFGQYHYRYKTGQEGDFFDVGFSPRKDRVTVYVMSGLQGFDDILARLGPHQAGKSTVHIKRFADIDKEALRDLIAECVRHLRSVEKSMGAIPRMSDIPPRTA